MEDQDIKILIRGHLSNLEVKPFKLKRFGDDFYKTKFYDIILARDFVSFKRNRKINKFYFSDIEEFFLKDNSIFNFILKKNKKKFSFKII